MKKLATCFIITISFLSFNLFSQPFTFTRISPETVILSDTLENAVHSYALLNPTSGTLSITLVRMVENLTFSWDSLGTSICNYNGCFSNEADTIIDTYSSSNADDSIIMYFYCRSFYYPYLIQGAGHVRLRAFVTGNPSQFIEVDFRAVTSGAIGIKQISSVVKDFSLGQNYPNPFNPATKIDFSIPSSERVSLRVYDILGREVKILVNEILAAGEYEVDFDGKGLSSGMYYYSLRSGENVSVKKMVLVK